ncbi:3-methyladenine DNA glycosylase [Neopestalotiopsis sp. 37M]|nr:3-methyladenine DNA glycosylase [Neopestalotiopsis sp. 37M]
MTTRRSARLSAAAEAKPSPKVMPPPPPPRSRKRKTAPEATEETVQQPDAPSTPQKRRFKAKEAATPPPATPTPSNAKLIGEPATRAARSATTPKTKPKSAAVERLANPEVSNATLLSPETSRIVAAKSLDEASPTKAGVSRTTTGNILKQACDHLVKTDPRMKPLIDKHHCRVFSAEGLAEAIDPFEALCSGIISQQVSGAAAKAIKKRFIELYPHVQKQGDRFPHPKEVADTKLDVLRTAGLSQRKAEYIQGLAEKFATHELTTDFLRTAPYEEVVEKLIAVRGLGLWSVEMFACFALKRLDVFSVGDLGVQRGMAAFAGKDVNKLRNGNGKWKYMKQADMEAMAEPFRPYRSVFMWYMWRVEETDISTLE